MNSAKATFGFAGVGLLAALFCLAGPATAQDQLGSVNNVSETSCPTTGLQGARCYTLRVGCPQIPGTAVKVKFFPAATPVGLVVLGTGGLGKTYWEGAPYGRVTVQDLLAANFSVAELLFPTGWQANTNGLGMRKGACRYATTVKWIKQHWSSTHPACSAGISAGGAVIGYGLSHFALDHIISFALLASGPPFSRLDYACDASQPSTVEYCSNASIGMELGLYEAQNFIDPAYSPTYTAACSTMLQAKSTQMDGVFLRDSINSSDANLNYAIPVEFIYGSLDTSAAINQGEYYRTSILSATSRSCVTNAPHAIANALVGAQAVADELIANCK